MARGQGQLWHLDVWLLFVTFTPESLLFSSVTLYVILATKCCGSLLSLPVLFIRCELAPWKEPPNNQGVLVSPAWPDGVPKWEPNG